MNYIYYITCLVVLVILFFVNKLKTKKGFLAPIRTVSTKELYEELLEKNENISADVSKDIFKNTPKDIHKDIPKDIPKDNHTNYIGFYVYKNRQYPETIDIV